MNIKAIRRNVRCSACHGKIGRRVNLMELDRAASWQYPTAGNVLTGEMGKAVAILCDGCAESAKPIVEAVEFRGAAVVYHPIADLPPWRPAPRTLHWFRDSPDEGAGCLCSWCGAAIVEPEPGDEDASPDWPAIRMWNDRNEEARFHPRCLDEAIEAGVVAIAGGSGTR